AGIAPNKFLAKIASDWRKPNGQFEVDPEEVGPFLRELPVEQIWGVGKRTAEKLHRLGTRTCGDLQRWDMASLTREFGKFGVRLHQLCRGEDDRMVQPDRERKSLSNERTFSEDVETLTEGQERLIRLLEELNDDLARQPDREISSCVVKLKFSDFQTTTVERAGKRVVTEVYQALLEEGWSRRDGRGIRLMGAGVKFAPSSGGQNQQELFEGGDLAGKEGRDQVSS
ncbi:MAG: DNA polymerase IV, partial [Verrucomicrobiota bacterium]